MKNVQLLLANGILSHDMWPMIIVWITLRVTYPGVLRMDMEEYPGGLCLRRRCLRSVWEVSWRNTLVSWFQRHIRLDEEMLTCKRNVDEFSLLSHVHVSMSTVTVRNVSGIVVALRRLTSNRPGSGWPWSWRSPLQHFGLSGSHRDNRGVNERLLLCSSL